MGVKKRPFPRGCPITWGGGRLLGRPGEKQKSWGTKGHGYTIAPPSSIRAGLEEKGRNSTLSTQREEFFKKGGGGGGVGVLFFSRRPLEKTQFLLGGLMLGRAKKGGDLAPRQTPFNLPLEARKEVKQSSFSRKGDGHPFHP